MPQLLHEYKPDDTCIYNADETGLYCGATPDGSSCYAYQKLSGSKRPMNRVAVLCCANMTGQGQIACDLEIARNLTASNS